MIEGLKKFGNGERCAFILATNLRGFRLKLLTELAKEKGISLMKRGKFDRGDEEASKTFAQGAGEKFKGGLADTSEKTVMLHTCTHLMLAGLRKIFGRARTSSGIQYHRGAYAI